MKNKCFSYRRILFELASALHAGSGESDPTQDMPVQIDVYGNPTINGTSITGVLRHLSDNYNQLFGDTNENGSRIIISDAVILDENGQVPTNLLQTSDYLKRVKHLAWRDHCAIIHTGVAKRAGKFDRTILISGVRFLMEFRIEAENKEQAEEEANYISNLFFDDNFRLGGGTRNGFGKIEVIQISGAAYDLSNKDDLMKFLKRPSSFCENTGEPILEIDSKIEHITKHYSMEPENFWLFSDGTGYGDLDIRPKYEGKVTWDSGKAVIEELPLLPATSIKGALAHRTAYHYNKLHEVYADKVEDFEAIQNNNKAVRILFGHIDDDNEGIAGHVLISDITCHNSKEKIFNHVKIDRFTGGALEGALFTEQVLFGGTLDFDITLLPFETEDHDNDNILKAFNLALDDLLNGRLPLGGGVMRGYGSMKGTMEE